MLLQLTASIQILSAIYIKNCRTSDVFFGRHLEPSQQISGMINVGLTFKKVIVVKAWNGE